jgi:glycosyltransferase involved in cell wall biosynthesis
MNDLEIVWVFEKYVNGGAFTSAWHLYNAFLKYKPNIKHKIYVCPLNGAFNKKKKWAFKYEVGTIRQLRKYLQSDGSKKVCFIHKLMNTKIDRYLKGIKLACPTYVINHTYSKRAVKYGPCDGVISVSKLMMKEQKAMNSSLNHFCIHNSIDSSLFKDISAFNQEDRSDYFVTGRINAINAIKYSNRWMKYIYNTSFNKPLLHDYIGSGSSLMKSAKSIVANNEDSTNKIVMHGQINKVQKKISILKSWDVFFYHINRHEGTSMSVLEALSLGVPVVCSNHHGNNEIIKDGVNGYVFKDLNNATKIINKLIDEPDRLDKLKKSTIEHFNNNLSSEVWVNKYIDVIKNSYKLSESGRVIRSHKKKNTPDRYTNFPLSRSGKKEKTKSKKKPKSKKRNTKTKSRSGVASGKKFTILSTFSNFANFADEWFDSILHQSYRPLEVVVVDDCSKDGGYDKLKSFSKIAKRKGIEYVVYRNSKKLHCGSSYYEAFKLASGDYFGILDGDDQLVDDAVNVIMEQYQKRPKIDYIYSQFIYCDHKMKQTKRTGFCSSPIEGKDLLSSELSRSKRHCYSHWRTFKRFPKVEKIFYIGGKRSVDKFMGYRLEEWGNGMFFDRVLYKYRKPHNKSITKAGGQISEWKKVRSKAHKRRKKYSLKPKSIITVK